MILDSKNIKILLILIFKKYSIELIKWKGI